MASSEPNRVDAETASPFQRRLQTADRCRVPGCDHADRTRYGVTPRRGAVLRRDGVYQSHVWKRGEQIDDGTLGTRRNGPAPTGRDAAEVRVRELEQQLERAKTRVATLEELVVAQGKCLALLVDARLDVSATSPNP